LRKDFLLWMSFPIAGKHGPIVADALLLIVAGRWPQAELVTLQRKGAGNRGLGRFCVRFTMRKSCSERLHAGM